MAGNGLPPPPDGNVSVREVYHLINTMRAEIKTERAELRAEMKEERAELKAEVQALVVAVDKKFDDHETEHVQHEAKRDREDDHLKSMIRWAVTTIMSGAGVAVAIYVAFKTGS